MQNISLSTQHYSSEQELRQVVDNVPAETIFLRFAEMPIMAHLTPVSDLRNLLYKANYKQNFDKDTRKFKEILVEVIREK